MCSEVPINALKQRHLPKKELFGVLRVIVSASENTLIQ